MSNMTARKSSDDIEAAIQSQLDESWSVWSVDSQITACRVQVPHKPAWAHIEPQQDDSFIISGYVQTEWNGTDEVSVLDFYGRSTSQEAAIDKLIELTQSREELGDELWTDEANVVSLETVAEAIEKTDAVFAAILEDHLARGLFGIIYHVPAGGDDANVADALREFDAVEIDGRPYPIRRSSVLASETHLYRRVPLYAGGTLYGSEKITVEEGARHVRDFVTSDKKPTPLPSASVTADKLVEELVDAGVTAIAVEPELSDEDELTLTVWTPNTTLYETVAPYETISVEDAELYLHCEFRCTGGPNFWCRVPAYADDDIVGMEPVSIDDGVSNIEEYVVSGCPRSVADTQWGGKR